MFKINSISLKNFGIVENFTTNNLTNINLIIGENGTGKTFFLKSLYSAVRTWEEFKRGDDIKPFNEILSEKLRWTYQVEKIGDIVTRGAEDNLTFNMSLGNESISYQFTNSAASKFICVSREKCRKEMACSISRKI